MKQQRRRPEEKKRLLRNPKTKTGELYANVLKRQRGIDTSKELQKKAHADQSASRLARLFRAEETMSAPEKQKREDIVMSMKKNMADFKKRYGKRAKDVMYATATKMAMQEGVVKTANKAKKNAVVDRIGKAVLLRGSVRDKGALHAAKAMKSVERFRSIGRREIRHRDTKHPKLRFESHNLSEGPVKASNKAKKNAYATKLGRSLVSKEIPVDFQRNRSDMLKRIAQGRLPAEHSIGMAKKLAKHLGLAHMRKESFNLSEGPVKASNKAKKNTLMRMMGVLNTPADQAHGTDLKTSIGRLRNMTAGGKYKVQYKTNTSHPDMKKMRSQWQRRGIIDVVQPNFHKNMGEDVSFLNILEGIIKRRNKEKKNAHVEKVGKTADLNRAFETIRSLRMQMVTKPKGYRRDAPDDARQLAKERKTGASTPDNPHPVRSQAYYRHAGRHALLPIYMRNYSKRRGQRNEDVLRHITSLLNETLFTK
jgi:hypothetical protein